MKHAIFTQETPLFAPCPKLGQSAKRVNVLALPRL